jgi:iron(III) transport system substrate-binding protein
VVYTALDQIFSEKILQQFEQETGIRTKAVYDTEATKTVGLVNRIIAERVHPQCDVFWNNEILRTIALRDQGCLQAYSSPSAADIPPGLKDAEGYWAGFAARARCLIYHTNRVSAGEVPRSLLELTNSRWQGKFTMAYPLFGTTATQAAALFDHWGSASAERFYRGLQTNGVVIAEGNAMAKDMVVRGEVSLGLTDTDDAAIAIQQGQPIRMVFLDQTAEQIGTLVIPNTVALIHNCPHPGPGRQLIDFLLRKETEARLARSGSDQMPVRPGVHAPENVPALSSIKAMTVDWNRVAAALPTSTKFLSELFVR